MDAFNPDKFRSIPAPKSSKEQAKDWVVYLVVMGILYFVFEILIKALSWPFKMLFMSSRQRFQAVADLQKAKIAKRTALRRDYATSSCNPLFQYIQRTKLHPELFRGDKENDQYATWFESLKAGKILDSDLMWAPEVYNIVKDDVIINPDFLDYFERQVNLHRAASEFALKVQFVKTLRNYYPEFTPLLNRLPDEIAAYREELKTYELQEELFNAITSKGISKEIAPQLIELATNVEDLKNIITVIKTCTGKGYSEDMGIFCFKNNYDPNDLKAVAVNTVVTSLGHEGIALAIANRDIEITEADEIIKKVLVSHDLDDIDREFSKLMQRKCIAQLSGR